MTDLITLRGITLFRTQSDDPDLCAKAADEIGRLRAALEGVIQGVEVAGGRACVRCSKTWQWRGKALVPTWADAPNLPATNTEREG